MLKNVTIILVEPQGPLNIGMVARAMANCGIYDLRLVNPVKYKKEEALRMACFAKDIVNNLKTFPILESALADASCSAAFTRRVSKDRAPYYYLKEAVPILLRRLAKGRLALVFGRETDGLTNDEIYQCDWRVSIPTSEPDGSLNLAQAVLIACYELFKKTPGAEREKKEFFAPHSETSVVIRDFDKLMFEIGYDDQDSGKLRQKIVRAFKDITGRAGIKPKEINMFLGIWAQIRKSMARPSTR